jgi:hypothetical protein
LPRIRRSRRPLLVIAGVLAVGLVAGILIGRFALTPSVVQVSGAVSVSGHQTAQVVFAYVKNLQIPGCNTANPVPPCFATIVANVTSASTYSVALPNGHLYSIATVDAGTSVRSLTANSTCPQELFLELDTQSSHYTFGIAC